jgi:hypothetical protein
MTDKKIEEGTFPWIEDSVPHEILGNHRKRKVPLLSK